jgi:hypothetical protein
VWRPGKLSFSPGIRYCKNFGEVESCLIIVYGCSIFIGTVGRCFMRNLLTRGRERWKVSMSSDSNGRARQQHGSMGWIN